jgi:hypothetical protein
VYTPLLYLIRATCLTHLILLDFIARTILGEEYRSFSHSLCSFLHWPVCYPFSPRSKYSDLFLVTWILVLKMTRMLGETAIEHTE